ncbi:heavy metal translocating P-type ATPase [Paenibacillus sp. YPG26]|uniref:heavy metal translocating P-type ATPase n=1 Tax=Paenibacillus sp. YPG26 TaxID=2878915 RepID=UPI00203BBFFC|nr:heavy metal translocating P-type ATPase [Paenibacillus sp. YPG26]USB33364.1 cadmium-translocating P-type ATPase [Paenibacillus sp. YPG26]
MSNSSASSKAEYKVQGLSCANCARELQDEIRKLEHGGDAALHYNSSRLIVNPKVDLTRVRKILKSDGATLVLPADTHSGVSPANAEFTAVADEVAAAKTDRDPSHVSSVGSVGSLGSVGSVGPASSAVSAAASGPAAHGHAARSHSHADNHQGGGHDHPHVHQGHTHDHADSHSHSHDPNGHDHPPVHQGHAHDHAGSHSHDHDHGGHGGQLIKWLLSAAAILYLATFALGNVLPSAALILFYAAATLLSGYSTFWRGLKNLLKLKFNMDTLMTVALAGAVVIGEWEEATLVAILFGLNELLEGYGMNRARKSMEALLSAAPKQAVVLRAEGRTETIPTELLQVNDIVIVRAGEKIPSDGTVTEGNSAVNEAAITGESIPVSKHAGDSVFGGSVNTEGLLKVKIEKAYQDSSLSKIMHLVQEAQDTKTPTELFIDKFARYYTPAIMIIAALVVLIPPLLFGAPWMKWVYEGLAILIVGCPCALVLSSPIALVSGMTRSARSGVLIKGGVHLEQLGRINMIAFDKTGTLTEGRPAVIQEAVYDPGRFYAAAGAMEQSSLHPLAEAVVRKAKESGITHFAPVDNLVTLPGQGIQGDIEGVRYWAGNEQLLKHVSLSASDRERIEADLHRMKEAGLTIVLVADAAHVLGIAGLADQIRAESRGVIARLHQAGIEHTVMLTGDHAGTAKSVAQATGVTDWYAGLLPEQKVDKIKELAARGQVAMVGDGINDAPALATAQLGIAMGKGTDSAVETADIVLMQDHLGKLPAAIRIARLANRIIRWNIGISLGLKLIALLLTIPGLLTLWIAVMSDMGATIIVTLLGLTILLGRDKEA